MKGRKHTVEQIISKLREAEVALAKGQPVDSVVVNISGRARVRYTGLS